MKLFDRRFKQKPTYLYSDIAVIPTLGISSDTHDNPAQKGSRSFLEHFEDGLNALD